MEWGREKMEKEIEGGGKTYEKEIEETKGKWRKSKKENGG